MWWTNIGDIGIVVGSTLAFMLTSCGTGEDNGNPDFKAGSNTRAESWFQFGSNAFEHNYESNGGKNEAISVPKTRHIYTRKRSRGRHLILTPYIQNNRLKEGVQAAKVSPPLLRNIKSYAGFFEVDESYESYMFFLLFPCIKKLHIRSHNIPLIVWLQGGTGSSSMHGAFRGNGPIRIETDGSLTYNNYSWTEKAHLVYFDNPVGAGYSYTSKKGFSKNLHEVATNLYSALKQFIGLFRLNKNPLYIASQGSGGKYVTSLGAMIHAKRKLTKMNFQGVVIGDGFIDPPNMMRYGAYMYQLGLIDSRVRDEFGVTRRQITSQLRKGNHETALKLYEQWVQGRKNIIPQIRRISGLPSLLNYQIVKWADEKKLLNSYFNNQSIRKALNSGVVYNTQNVRCQRALRSIMLKSQVGHLKRLMNKYRVLLYHGQMSIKNAYPFMLNYLGKIQWNGIRSYKKNKRLRWIVDGEVAGYYKTGGGFTELLIRNAGQMVLMDQPKWAQRMINNFIQKRSLNADHD